MLSSDAILGSNGFYSHWTFPAFLAAQQKLNVHRIAFHHVPAHLWLDHYRCVGLKELRMQLQDAGIAVGVFHPGRYHYSLFAEAGTQQAQYTYDYLCRCMDVAGELSCTTVCLYPNGALENNGGYTETLCSQLAALCDDACKRGITLCLQTVTPEAGAALHTLSQLRQVLNALPKLMAALDTVPVSLVGESIPQWFATLGERIRFVRFQDGRSSCGRIWGQGVFPCKTYATQLHQSGYAGSVSINDCTDRYQTNPAAADRSNRAAALALLKNREVCYPWD